MESFRRDVVPTGGGDFYGSVSLPGRSPTAVVDQDFVFLNSWYTYITGVLGDIKDSLICIEVVKVDTSVWSFIKTGRKMNFFTNTFPSPVWNRYGNRRREKTTRTSDMGILLELELNVIVTGSLRWRAQYHSLRTWQYSGSNRGL